MRGQGGPGTPDVGSKGREPGKDGLGPAWRAFFNSIFQSRISPCATLCGTLSQQVSVRPRAPQPRGSSGQDAWEVTDGNTLEGRQPRFPSELVTELPEHVGTRSLQVGLLQVLPSRSLGSWALHPHQAPPSLPTSPSGKVLAAPRRPLWVTQPISLPGIRGYRWDSPAKQGIQMEPQL